MWLEMSGVFLKKTKNEKIIFSQNPQIMSESQEQPLDELTRMKFNTNCLDQNPDNFLNGTEPLIINSMDAAGNVVLVLDMTNVPECEKVDFSDTPNHHQESEANLLKEFGINDRVCNTFEPTEHPGWTEDYRIYQFTNPITLTRVQKQKRTNALRNPPAVLLKPNKRALNYVPLEDYSVAEIMNAMPGKSSNNPVTLEDSEDESV